MENKIKRVDSRPILRWKYAYFQNVFSSILHTSQPFTLRYCWYGPDQTTYTTPHKVRIAGIFPFVVCIQAHREHQKSILTRSKFMSCASALYNDPFDFVSRPRVKRKGRNSAKLNIRRPLWMSWVRSRRNQMWPVKWTEDKSTNIYNTYSHTDKTRECFFQKGKRKTVKENFIQVINRKVIERVGANS